jgi:hypothetical protein
MAESQKTEVQAIDGFEEAFQVFQVVQQHA